MKATALPSGPLAGDSAAPPLVVRSRSRPIALVMLGGVAVGLFMVLVRRGGDLEVDEWLLSAGALVLGFWLAAQSCGLLLRRTTAGYALRVDARGIHHPGWDLVPWRDVRDLRIRRVGGSDSKSLWHLVLDIDPRCPGPRHGTYVRWLFGPVEGLWRPSRPVEIPLFALEAEPQQLFRDIERCRAAAAKGTA